MTTAFTYQGFGALSQFADQFSTAAAATQMKAMAATGANSISLVSRLWTETSTSSELTSSVRSESDASLIKGIQTAQSLGLSVILKPHIGSIDGFSSHDLKPADAASFFADYKAEIVHLAQIAQQTGVSALSIGNEMGKLTGAAYRGEWVDIIAAVRQVYSGEITYSAATNEALNVSFWDQVDFIGFNAYFSLATDADPTVAELAAAWHEVPIDNYWAGAYDNKSPIDFVKSLAETYGKQVMLTEVGYRSIDGAATNPGEWDRPGVNDVVDQANAYEAFMQVWTAEAGSWFRGVDFWRWNLDRIHLEDGYSPVGKPAQSVAQTYFNGGGVVTNLVVEGSSANDIVDIGRGDDLIKTGIGDDIIRGGAGDDTIYAGVDTLAKLATTTVTITGYGTSVDGVAPELKVLVNGVQVGDAFRLTAATDPSGYQTYSITFQNPLDIASLDIAITNGVSGRAAFLREVTINGYKLDTSDVTNASAPGSFKLYAKTIHLDATQHQDLFYGSGSDNDLIEGGAGDDKIYGGAGIDTAVYNGAKSGYSVGWQDGKLVVRDLVSGRDGVDQLSGVEYLQFADGVVATASIAGSVSGGAATPPPMLLASSLALRDSGSAPDFTASGLTVAGAKVELFDGAGRLSTATAGSDGSYAFAVTDLAEGLHNLKIVATANGVSSAAAPVGVYLVAKGANLVSLLNAAGTIPDKVWITDNATPIAMTVAQMNATAAALDRSATSYSIAIKDTPANILAALPTLDLAADVSSITLTGGSVFVMSSMSAMSRALADDASALAKIAGQFSFSVTTTGTVSSTTTLFDRAGLMTQSTTTTQKSTGSEVYERHADGHTVLSTYDLAGAKKSELVQTGGERVSTIWGVTDREYSTLVTRSTDGVATSYEQYRANGSLYSMIKIAADGVRTSEIYDRTGSAVTTRTIAQTDGTSLTQEFSRGVLTQETLTDSSAKHVTTYGVVGKAYVTQTVDYDSSGKMTEVEQVRADGTLYSTTTYGANGQKTTVYATNGDIATRSTISPNGTSLSEEFAAGVLVKQTVVDAGGKHVSTYGVAGKPYTSHTADYDFSGKTVAATQFRADGSVYAKMSYGVDAVVRSDYFDAAGKLTQRLVTDSNGVKLQKFFVDGVKTQEVLIDAAGRHTTDYGIIGKPYGSQTFHYNTAGALLQRVQYNLDGTQSVINYMASATLAALATAAATTAVTFDTLIASSTKSIAGLYYENLTLAGSASVNATGNSLDNVITGNTGANVLDGGAGADVMIGGAGNDTYYVDNSGDRVIEARGGGTDAVFTTVSFSLAGQEIENLTMTGAQGATLTGNELKNTIKGGAGNDVIDGGGGIDAMYGGKGDDVYYIDQLGDRAYELDNEGRDTIYSSISYSMTGQYVETLILTGSSNINATGNGLNNVIVGNSGDNVIDGGNGRDVITGGAGRDTFVFSFAPTGTNLETITDFTVGQDRIQLTKSAFAGLQTGALNSDAFYTGAAAHDATDRVIYNKATGALFFDQDGSGSKYQAIQFAQLSSNLSLSHADIFVA